MVKSTFYSYDDKIARLSFQLKVDKIRKAIDASSVLKEDKKRLEFIKSAFKLSKFRFNLFK